MGRGIVAGKARETGPVHNELIVGGSCFADRGVTLPVCLSDRGMSLVCGKRTDCGSVGGAPVNICMCVPAGVSVVGTNGLRF